MRRSVRPLLSRSGLKCAAWRLSDGVCKIALSTMCEDIQNAKSWFGMPGSEKTNRIALMENRKIQKAFGNSAPDMKDKILNRCHLYQSQAPFKPTPEDSSGDIFGAYEYFQERPAGESNVVVKRRSVLAENGAKEVVINVNRLSERLPQPVSLLYLRPSLSQRFVAFTLEVGPDSRKVLFIKDMVQTAVCEITFDGVDSVGGFIHKFEWGPASAPHDIYLVFDKDSVRPCIVYRYSLEEERLFRPKRFRALNITVRRMQLIMEESDLSCFVDVYRTKDDVYMIINSNNKNSSEAAVVTPKQLHCPKLVFSPRERGLQYFLTHCNNNFYVVSNLGKVGAEIETADSMSLYKCHYVDWAANHLCRPEHWVKVWPSSKLSTDMHSDPFGVATVAEFVKTAMLMTVEDIDFFKNVAVLYGRKRGMATISKVELESGKEIEYSTDLLNYLGGANYQIFPSSNDHNDESSIRFDISSPLLPSVTGSLQLSENSSVINWSNRIEIPGSPQWQADLYQTEHSLVPIFSDDDLSTKEGAIPLTIISRKGRTNAVPLLLIGYGSYGVSVPMSFRPELTVLLEKGWSIAFAHVRGGGELGRAWYNDGRGSCKWNTFNDFAACAMYLIQEGYTTKYLLCAEFESAGGLIGGAMINEFPSLFAGIILRNPFLDICSAMQDDTQPLTAHEYDEWGNPKDSTQFDYIKSYCPYSNIGKKWNNLNDKCGEHVTMVCDKRPHVYVSVGMHDRNVAPWENLRWVGKLRNLRGAKSGNHFCEEDDSKGIFLNISSDAGHSGPGCLDDRYNERAYELCFLEAAVNVSNRKCPWPKAPMT